MASIERAAIPRARSERDFSGFVAVHVVWELTLACNLKCSHCGSRAGRRRPDELTAPEALVVVDQLARLGTRELTIIGGEAYLRRDWTEIVAPAAGHGMYVAMQTGARALTEKRLAAGIAAGLAGSAYRSTASPAHTIASAAWRGHSSTASRPCGARRPRG